MSSLEVTYRRLARPWQPDELAERYHAAYGRGASDLPPGEQPSDRPVTLLATAVPRLISLAVAANVLHVLPAAADRAPVADELLSTLETTRQVIDRRRITLLSSLREAISDLDETKELAARVLPILRAHPVDLPAVDIRSISSDFSLPSTPRLHRRRADGAGRRAGSSRDRRPALQDVMRKCFEAVVEHATRRRVVQRPRR